MQRRLLIRLLSLFVLLVLAGVSGAALAASDITYRATDGRSVYATLARASPNSSAIALLFHQARGNRHEYDRIAPRLRRLGYDTLAVDQRSGGAMFGHDNVTVARRGSSGSYLAAYNDLRGAVRWAKARDYRTIVAVGSSYSASLVLKLAANADDALAAAAAFSPGEYFDDPNAVKKWAAKIAIPTYITTDPKEQAHVTEVLQRADDSVFTRYRPAHGVHGASTLDRQRDPAGWRANWQSFRGFMARFAPDDAATKR